MWFNERTRMEIVVLLAAVILTIVLMAWHAHDQFRVLYSLDTKNNDQAIISVINNAHSYVYFAVYTFTRATIADALIAAERRGVTVWGITDEGQSALPLELPILARLRAAGITIETEKHPDGIMHVKAIVTDREYASGSYNWTTSATLVNDEVLEIGNNGYLRQQYLAIIKKILITNE